MTRLSLSDLHASFAEPGRRHPGRRGTPHYASPGGMVHEGRTQRYTPSRRRKRKDLKRMADPISVPVSLRGKKGRMQTAGPVTQKTRRLYNRLVQISRHKAITARRQNVSE